MLVPIFIDTSSLSAEFNLTRAEVDGILDYVVKQVTAGFYREWSEQAKRNLSQTRRRYLESLVLVDEGRMRGAVVLKEEDKLVRGIEEGMGAFDMKEGFMNSPKAHKSKTRKGGWYLTIPFRVATPEAQGDSDVFAFKMPDEVYQVAKKMETNIPISGAMRSKGLKLEDIPESLQVPKTRAGVSSIPTSKTFEEYKNKTSIYAGITKVQDNDTGQSRYMSFRRVSDQSDQNAFIHPGINSYNLATKAMDIFDDKTIIDRSIDSYLASLGF